MMVVCLALANAGYLLWVRVVDKSRVTAAATNPVPTLRLVSEGASMPSVAAPDGVPAIAALNVAPHVAGTGAGTAVASAVAGAPSGDADPIHATSAGALPTTVTRCVTIGPFRDVSEAAHAATLLRGGGYDPRQRVVDGEVWAGLWVYLPIPAGHAASDAMLAKLKAAGIEDALEMPGPADGSVISLGLFSEQKRAQARVAQAQSLGFSSTIADRKRNGNVYWIDLDLKPTDGVLKPADFQGDAGHISRLEVKACLPSGADPP